MARANRKKAVIMALWKTQTTLEKLKESSKNTLIEHLGIEYLEIGDDFLKAKMPVDNSTKAPRHGEWVMV